MTVEGTVILLSQFCEPGSRKLRLSHHFGPSNYAFAPKRRVVENGNGRLPGGTLVLLAAAMP